MRQHASPLIRQRKVYAGHPGAGQIVTYCTHPSHDAGSEGFLVSVDIALLAQDAADAHLAEHQRADSVPTP
jgi:hypothetical protein